MIRNSSNILVYKGTVSLNRKDGITAVSTDNLQVAWTSVGLNQDFGVALFDGTATVEYSDVSNNLKDNDGRWGVGVYLRGGTHHVDNNDIYYNPLAGIVMLAAATVSFTGNEIHDSESAVLQQAGCLPNEGENNVSCTVSDPCITWASLEPSPAPPPSLPIGAGDLTD